MKHPEIARRWTAEYPGQKNLPAHKRVAEALARRKLSG